METCLSCHVNHFMAEDNSLCANFISKCMLRVRGLVPVSEFWDICFPLISRLPTPVFLPGKSHGRRSLVGCSPWGHEESDTTEWLHFHFSLSCTGEGNGNPLQCSCLENPRMAEPGGLPSMASHRVGHWLCSSSSSYITSSQRLAGGHSFCSLLMSMSEAFSISFTLCTLIKLYYTKALSDQACRWAQIEIFLSGGQESWGLWWLSNNLSLFLLYALSMLCKTMLYFLHLK